MNSKELVLMFLFAAVENQPEPQIAYDNCCMGAYEFASSLGPIADELLAKFDREQPFTHLLYVECEDVAKAMYQYMLKHCDMPNSLRDLEGYYETE